MTRYVGGDVLKSLRGGKHIVMAGYRCWWIDTHFHIFILIHSNMCMEHEEHNLSVHMQRSYMRALVLSSHEGSTIQIMSLLIIAHRQRQKMFYLCCDSVSKISQNFRILSLDGQVQQTFGVNTHLRWPPHVFKLAKTKMVNCVYFTDTELNVG